MSLEIKAMQEKVDKWIRENGGYWDPLSISAQIQEEAGELAREVNNRYGGRKRKSSEEERDIGEEICDLMFALICMANSHEIDLEKYWTETISRRCERDKTRYK